MVKLADLTLKEIYEKLIAELNNKKSVSLGFGSKGSGTTVWDRNRTKNEQTM